MRSSLRFLLIDPLPLLNNFPLMVIQHERQHISNDESQSLINVVDSKHFVGP